jgi:calcineurin-like phosphoesterase family protein
MIWFTSDTHFGHERIIELCNRPFDSVQSMNAALIANWNACVAPEDTVFHMGDAVMGSFAENVQILGQLNGTIHLIPGNHDRFSVAYHHKNPSARDRFAQMYIDQGVVLMNEQEWFYEDDRPVTEDFLLCHYPFTDERYPELCPADSGQWLIHGHVHDEWQVNGRQINVGVDMWDFMPVSLNTILAIIG